MPLFAGLRREPRLAQAARFPEPRLERGTSFQGVRRGRPGTASVLPPAPCATACACAGWPAPPRSPRRETDFANEKKSGRRGGETLPASSPRGRPASPAARPSPPDTPRAPLGATRELASIINKSCGREWKRLSDVQAAQALPELMAVEAESLPLTNVLLFTCRSPAG